MNDLVPVYLIFGILIALLAYTQIMNLRDDRRKEREQTMSRETGRRIVGVIFATLTFIFPLLGFIQLREGQDPVQYLFSSMTGILLFGGIATHLFCNARTSFHIMIWWASILLGFAVLTYYGTGIFSVLAAMLIQLIGFFTTHVREVFTKD